MQPFASKATAPSDDRRWKLVDATMRKHGNEPSALIESLHTVQESFGYLDDVALRYVAQSLRVPYSKVYGVSTFYHFFTLKPQGEHTCVVCTGTACYIKGAQRLVDTVGDTVGIKAGETTSDGIQWLGGQAGASGMDRARWRQRTTYYRTARPNTGHHP